MTYMETRTATKTTSVTLHNRNGETHTELHTEHDAYKLASIFNSTAYAHRTTDVWVSYTDTGLDHWGRKA